MAKLDRLVPPDWEHVRKYPFAGLTTPVRGVPVLFGINWYTNFDTPMQMSVNGHRHWVIGKGDLGTIRGGHSLASLPGDTVDRTSWWSFYDQGEEGACASFGTCRMMSLLNRKEYDPWPLYKKVEQPGGGSYVRDNLEVIRTSGPFLKGSDRESPEDGISTYRWVLTVAEIHQILDSEVADRVGAVPLLNSWGRDGYPHIVYIMDEAIERVLKEDGEAAVVTDR
jgi:hypothetical protein